MDREEAMRDRLAARRIAHEIHDMTYLRHVTGASEPEIRHAIGKVGRGDRSEVEHELRRSGMLELCYSADHFD